MKFAPDKLLRLLPIAVLCILCFPACKKEVAGCTDPASATYNPDADIDDGSCQYRGCMDPTSDTYDSKATIDDGSCQYKGCTDPQSETYNPKATIDDGSCQYKGCTDPKSNSYNPQATIDDGSCTYDRDAFIGVFDGAETCTFQGITNAFTWVMTITAGTSDDITEINMSNLGDYQANMKGIVDGNKVTFNYEKDGFHVDGSGTITGNKLEFNYIASIPSQGLEEACRGEATKQ